MQGVIIATPSRYGLPHVRDSVGVMENADVSGIRGHSFSISRGDHLIIVRQEDGSLPYLDGDELAAVHSILRSNELAAFAFEYRMTGFEFVTEALVIFLNAMPACFLNDFDIIANGSDVVKAIGLFPQWDWRTATALPGAGFA